MVGTAEQDEASTRARLEAMRATAEQRVADLERDVAGMVAASAESNADDEHDPEGATIAFERQQLVALLDRAREACSDVDRALERLGSGEHGRCETCGGPIAAARLEARPTARTCITCAR